MKSKSYRAQQGEDRAHELCVFLGGDDTAVRISNALRRWGDVTSVSDLRSQYADGLKLHGEMNWPGHPLTDIRYIGEKAMERIKEKIEGKIEGPAVPLMDVPTASLIIRMELALMDEGIGAKALWDGGTNEAQQVDTAADDRAVLGQAVKVAGHLFHTYELREAGLL